MAPVQIGLMLVPECDPADAVALAERAEAQGFDFVACGEHVLFHVPTPNAFVTLAAVAARTRSIRLLSALTILPLYPAGLVAKMAATLDRIAGGRFDLGIGVGGEYPPEFAACGVPRNQRGARADETLEILTRLFAGEALELDGRFASFDGAALAPLPAQPGGPPLWIGGRSDASMLRAAMFGAYWFPYMTSPERLHAGLERVSELAVAAGRPADAVSGAVYVWSAVDHDSAAAERAARESLQRIYHQDFDRLLAGYVPTGTPDQVAERLGEYIDAGARAVLFSPACPVEDIPKMTDLFADEVLPRLRSRSDQIAAAAGPDAAHAEGIR